MPENDLCNAEDKPATVAGLSEKTTKDLAEGCSLRCRKTISATWKIFHPLHLFHGQVQPSMLGNHLCNRTCNTLQ